MEFSDVHMQPFIYLFISIIIRVCVFVRKRPPNNSRVHTLGNVTLEYTIEFVSKFNFIEPVYAFSQFLVIWLHFVKEKNTKKELLQIVFGCCIMMP